MSVSGFISQLQQLDVRLFVEDGRLRCNAPKGVLTPELRESIASQKEEIIAFLQDASTARVLQQGALPAVKIQPAARSGSIPLSFTQTRLWFLEQLDPGNVAYSITLTLKFEGKLDIRALEKSLNEINRRHESLRTYFAADGDGQPVQRFHPVTWIELPIYDLASQPDSAEETSVKENAARQYLRSQGRVPFDLYHGPLFRANLVRLSETCHWLFINMHHIISDGWSSSVFFSDLFALYQAYTAGRASPLAELPIQYADFAIWQRQALGLQMLAKQLEYWKQKLSGRLPVLELPTDRPRGKTQTTNGAINTLALPADLVAKIKQECIRQGVTLFIFLEAVFNVLLYRYTNQEDIIVGTANANRNQQEVEKLIGFFANTLALRFDLSGNPTFADLLKQVRDVSLEAFANHELPFENIVEVLHPDRDASHSPIFQVMFILQNLPFRTVTFPELQVSPVITENGTAKYDLTLYAWENPEEGLTCDFEYNTDLFDAATIERMAGHYLTLLQAACADPCQKIGLLPMLTGRERSQILKDWNATQAVYPRHLTLPALFEAQAARTPDAIAVCDEREQISYAALDRRANQLARCLQELGVGPETLVGVSLTRCIDMVISLLAIQKAGGAYLPLDPHFPIDRLAYMLQDSRASVLITQSGLTENFASSRAQLICLDREAAAIARFSDRPVELCGRPENLAYLLYTSGSTGRPKGVQVLQRNLVNFLCSMQRQPGLTAQDVLLSVTTLSFDIAGLELYLPLISGARLVLVSSATAADGPRLKESIEQSGATIMQATPATWRLLIAAGWRSAGWRGSGGFKILCGGEALPPELAASLLERCGSLWNMYGPTETTIWSTLCPVTSPDEPITIGRPIANTQVYILDGRGQPVPAGVPGELYIGGDGVARGYLNRPELTAEKFIPDPFRTESEARGAVQAPLTGPEGSRMYRTGDLARFLPDGRIDFLGRIDNQVKLRGFRIELGEIESALAQHPGVGQAVVTVREDTPGDKRLVAYLTAGEGRGDSEKETRQFVDSSIRDTDYRITNQRIDESPRLPVSASPRPSPSDLRAALRGQLPEYMIPSIFIFLDALPLTPNGKVDRRALPAPEASRPELATNFIAPRSETEQVLAAIWQQALNVEKVGVNDNFFELGGHSLLIVQVHQQITQKFQTDLSIAQMFQFPTIQTLAQYLNRAPDGKSQQQPRQNTLDRARMQQEAIERQKRTNQHQGSDV